MYASFSDKELINSYLSGSNICLEELIKRHRRKVFSYILLVVKDRDLANDLFQDTFVKVINQLRGGFYSDEGKFLPWVLRIAHNITIDHFRKLKKLNIIENSENYCALDSVKVYDECIEDKLIMQQILRDVSKLVELLPDEQKEILNLRFYQNLSFKDIADMNSISINTALGRMRYAVLNLRKLAKEKNIILSL